MSTAPSNGKSTYDNVVELNCQELCPMVVKHNSEIKELYVLMDEVINSESKIYNKLGELNCRMDRMVEMQSELSKNVTQIKDIILALSGRLNVDNKME